MSSSVLREGTRNMDERSDIDKVDEVMLPGFRFHPTDEELVGFYLKRKIQQKPLPIEIIKQLDIYKFDPWDLPKLAMTGEKEWYFYCPRDRKYRNSSRPNRVTGAGFWKATGTDRPIYSLEGTKCIGLKKSLVFYRGRAAKGIKTDWMMHEFRLPSVIDLTPNRRPLDKSLPANDSWAICRIFKKNSMAQKSVYPSWVPPTPENICLDTFSHAVLGNQFTSENISCTTEAGSAIQFCFNNDFQQPSANFSSSPGNDIPSYKVTNSTVFKQYSLPISNMEVPSGFMFSPLNTSMPEKSNVEDFRLRNHSPLILGDIGKSIDFGSQQQSNNLNFNPPHDMHMNTHSQEDETCEKSMNISNMNNQWGNMRSFSFPFNLLEDEWKPSLSWDSPPCPSEISACNSTNKCYT